MNLFIASFLIGVSLVFIPFTSRFLLILQSVFNLERLPIWQTAILWGVVSSVIFFVSKDIIEKSGHLKFWIGATVLAIFLTAFIMFVSTSPNVVY